MERRQFIKDIAYGSIPLVLGSPLTSCGVKSKKAAPNILWIISEDTSPDYACYGNPLVKTPHIDRLAAEGVRFTQAFATAPVCSPARSAFNTGMYQTSIGAHQHRTWKKKPLPGGVKTISDHFRAAGYYTGNSRGLQFDKPGKTDWNFTVDEEPFDGTDWRDRDPDQPFFAQVNLFMTHRVFKRDKQNRIDPAAVALPPIYPDHPLLRRDWADYLESIQVLDSQIGQVLQRLEDDGLAENTIVFYFGDHGSAHLRAKQWLYDGGIRVPMIVRWPGKLKAGTVNDDLVSLIDLAPTSLKAAGILVPSTMQGAVVLGRGQVSRKYIYAARDRCDETVDCIRCVRDKQYKYIRNYMPERPYTQFNNYKTNQYPAAAVLELLHKQGELDEVQARFMADRKPDEELYDLVNDPYETKNLASQGDYDTVLRRMRHEMDCWMAETGDPGAQPEAQEERDHWITQQDKRRRMHMANKGLPYSPTPEQHVRFWEEKMLKGGSGE